MGGDPTVEQLILDKIDTLETNINTRLSDQQRAVNQRFTSQDKTLEEIKTQTTRTNGRVTLLEETRATKTELEAVKETVDSHEAARQRGLGVTSVLKVVPYVMSILLSAGMVILISALTGVHP